MINKFKRELVIRRYRISTIETYCSCLKIVFSKIGEQPEVEEIKDFLLTIKNASYHKQFVGAIHRYFEFVLQKKLSLKDIPYPKRNEQLPDVLSIEEVKLIYDAIVNRKHRAIFSLLYGCGLRVSEVINLKLKDIDRSRMIINIKDAKGGKDRQVMLSTELLLLLEEYYRLFKPKEYLFNGHLCDTYSDRSINEFLKTYSRKAGVKKRVHAHKLRHCFATHLLEAGTEMTLIQKLLGHKNIKTTQIYSHVSTKLISKVKSPFDFISSLSTDISQHPLSQSKQGLQQQIASR